MSNWKFQEITSKIIGCSMQVHSELGAGFQEIIYQRALAKELADAGVQFEREKIMAVMYKGESIGERRVDFLVEGMISVELKALTSLEPVHFAQGKNYLEAYNLEVGLLINFGAPSLEFRRLNNRKIHKSNPQ